MYNDPWFSEKNASTEEPIEAEKVVPVKTEAVVPPQNEKVVPFTTEKVIPVKTEKVLPVKIEKVLPVKTEKEVPVKPEKVEEPIPVQLNKPVQPTSSGKNKKGLGKNISYPMNCVRQNEIQGRNMVFSKAHAYSISFCLTWSIVLHKSTTHSSV